MVVTTKSFLRQFSPTTTKMVDVLLATALDLVNIKHQKLVYKLLLLYFINLEYAAVNAGFKSILTIVAVVS